MSKYTTEVRYIFEHLCGLDESKGYADIGTIIANARGKVFNFEYPIFNEDYRSVLETKILKHFYTREIGEETVGLWKLRLDRKLNEIMPFYNKLYESELFKFDPMKTTDLQSTKVGNSTHDKSIGETANDRSAVTSNTHNDLTHSVENRGLKDDGYVGKKEDYNLHSETPQGSLSGVDDETYLTDATKVTNDILSNGHTYTLDVGSDKNTGDVTQSGNTISTSDKNTSENLVSTEKFIDRIFGYQGYIPSEMLKKYRETLINVDMMIISELEPLFMQLW